MTKLGRSTAARVLALDDPGAITAEQFMAIREQEDCTVAGGQSDQWRPAWPIP
jgi:hypothetical protein